MIIYSTFQIRLLFSELKGARGPLIDLGSGDGRVVIAAAKQGFTAHGELLTLFESYFL